MEGAHEVKGKRWQREDQRKDLPQFDNSYVMSFPLHHYFSIS